MIETTGAVPVGQARRSAAVVGIVLALLAVWRIHMGAERLGYVLAAAAAIVFVCAAIPRAAVVFHRRWMALAHILGYINSRIILSLLFFLIVTPIGIAVRLAGHDPLNRRKGKAASYWQRRSRTRQNREDYERGF